jgi:hypothetical protein
MVNETSRSTGSSRPGYRKAKPRSSTPWRREPDGRTADRRSVVFAQKRPQASHLRLGFEDAADPEGHEGQALVKEEQAAEEEHEVARQQVAGDAAGHQVDEDGRRSDEPEGCRAEDAAQERASQLPAAPIQLLPEPEGDPGRDAEDLHVARVARAHPEVEPVVEAPLQGSSLSLQVPAERLVATLREQAGEPGRQECDGNERVQPVEQEAETEGGEGQRKRRDAVPAGQAVDDELREPDVQDGERRFQERQRRQGDRQPRAGIGEEPQNERERAPEGTGAFNNLPAATEEKVRVFAIRGGVWKRHGGLRGTSVVSS